MEPSSRLLDIFLEIAAIEGLSGNEKAIADYVKTFLACLDLAVYEDDAHRLNNGNSGNLLCRVGSGGEFVLLSHLDTARSTGNLKPVITEDRICSDGTTILGADNRAGVAVLLYVIEHALKNRLPINDFTLAFTVCEESTMIGSRNLSLNGAIRMGFVFDSALRPGKFIYRSFGARGFNVRITGKASHSGIAPENGISAIAVAARAIGRLPLGRVDEETTANVGKIEGGSAVNVIPEKALLAGEVRSLELDKVESLIGTIHREFQAAANSFGAALEFESQWDFKPYRITPEMEVYRRIETALRKCGLTPQPSISAGGSDANSLNARGIPAVNIGIGAQNPHSNDEFILIEDLHKSAQIALELIRA